MNASGAPDNELSVICFPHFYKFCKFFRNERPIGRGLLFRPGDIETRIQLITNWPSLFPISQAYTSIGSLCRLLSSYEEKYRVSKFRCSSNAGLGVCSRPESFVIVWGSCDFPSYLSYLLVQAIQPIALVASYDLYHRFTYVHHTSYLVAIPILAIR
ncbi:TPA: hypothetical protein JBI74_09455 [Legionella pneumophila]|nr:hypothetical protein [Legionella pneumophila]